MKPLFFIIIFFTIALDVFAQKTTEDYRVYDAVIRHMFAGNKVTFDTQASIKQIVIHEQTNTDFAYSRKKENWEKVKTRLQNKISDEIIADFEAKHTPSVQLIRSFEPGLNYTFLSQKECDTIFDAKGNYDRQQKNWTNFYEKYSGSGGYIMLSNVGYNKGKEEALVFLVHWCGSLCGTGHYILLEKIEDSWEVQAKEMIWIS